MRSRSGYVYQFVREIYLSLCRALMMNWCYRADCRDYGTQSRHQDQAFWKTCLDVSCSGR